MLTLYTTPVIYLYLGRLQKRFSRRKRTVVATATPIHEKAQAAE